MIQISIEEFVLRIMVALGCGLIVGIDRELKNKPLGARSYMIVCAGSAAWMMVTIDYTIALATGPLAIQIDPARVIQGLVGAIGFLGAGAILSRRQHGHLSGVASGAAVWGVGAIGVACGVGQLSQALIIAVLFFLVLNLYDLVLRLTGTPSDPHASPD